MSTVTTVLASSSPSRLSLLRQAGIEPVVIRPQVDEHAVVDELSPQSVIDEVALLAQTKARAVTTALAQDLHENLVGTADTCVLIACDSLLELNGESVGKPGNAPATAEVWKRLRGKSAVLHTGHRVALLRRGRAGWDLIDQADAVGSTTLHTADISDEEIAAYCKTGEPFHVAGALTIDRYGAAFVESLEGDHTNVIGLSIPLARTLITGLGISWPDLWKITST